MCVCVCVCVRVRVRAGEPTVEVKKKEICYNSTQNALISGEVAGFPVGIISFHQLLSDAMELVCMTGVILEKRELRNIIPLPLPSLSFLFTPYSPCLSPKVTDSRVSVSQPTEDDKTFNISISNLMTSDQGTYVVLATNSEGSSEPQHISLVVKGDIHLMVECSVFPVG